MPIAVGESLGNYRILRRIGSGGMGLVYLAEQDLIGRRVALKVIHKELANNREIVTRFFNEARAVNRIGNEHVVEINDLGQAEGGEYYFVMEYIDGHTLAHILEDDGPLEVGRALHVGAQIADALDAAHRCAIMHRDLKPDNVMLVERHGDPDYVKVLDFGLAKMFERAGGGAQLTARGVILGTPQFMAPEACEAGGSADYRSDIYSLGILLFQMCTGDVPFDGATMGEVLIKQVRNLPPAPRGLNGDIPPAVEQIILRCLGKSPDARFQSMADVRAALLDPDRYLANGPPLMPSSAVIDDDKVRTLVRQRSELNLPLPPAGPSTVRDLNEIAGLAERVRHARASSQSDTLRQAISPKVPKNHTVRLAEPRLDLAADERQRSPTPRWLLFVAAIVISAALGVAGVWLFARPDTSAPDTSVTVVDAAPSVDSRPPLDAASPADARMETVRIQFKTSPEGAEVVNARGEVLGITPATIELPKDGAEHVLLLRHPEAGERTKTVRADSDHKFEVALGQ